MVKHQRRTIARRTPKADDLFFDRGLIYLD